jgi:trk system potassium uptake protein TrkH
LLDESKTLVILAKISLISSFMFLVPALYSYYLNENYFVYLPSFFICLIPGILFYRVPFPKLYRKDVYTTITLAWLLTVALSSLPFIFEGVNVLDSVFESMSALTTTGFEVLDVSTLPRALLFFRGILCWMGGIGIITTVLLIMSLPSGFVLGSYHHPVKKETLDIGFWMTAKNIWKIYFFISGIGIFTLTIFRMPFMDSIANTMSAVSTSGYVTDTVYLSTPHISTVLYILAFFGSINFMLLSRILIKKEFKLAGKNRELRFMLIILLLFGIAVPIATGNLFGFLDVVQAATTTGFGIFTTLTEFSKAMLILVMMFGATYGSTGGGLKLMRVIILYKSVLRYIKSSIVPSSAVMVVRVGGRPVEEGEVVRTAMFALLFISTLFASTALISLLENMSLSDAMFQSSSALSNVGLSVRGHQFNPISKVVMMVVMLAGRLEFIPLILSASTLVPKSRLADTGTGI